MGGHHQPLILFLLFLTSFMPISQSWGWFSSTTTQTSTENPMITSDGYAAEFSMETLNDQRGIKLVDNARRRLASSNSCWQNAYRGLFSGCSEILSDKEKQSRLAWHLSDCFQKDSGRTPFPFCDTKSPMVICLKNLDEFAHKIYLEFFLETNSICHQLQTDAFKHETERLVNDLKKSAQFAEDKLENIEEKSEELLQSSNRIHDSLTSIDLRTQRVVQTSKNVEDQIDVVLKHSKAIFEQAAGIATSQSELQKGQAEMKEKLEEGMAMLNDAYQSLGQEMGKLRNEAVEIEKVINEVGDSMSLKMKNLQNKADDIESVAGLSLDKQKQLLDGQSKALQGLDSLTKFQSQALEESRATLQNLAEFGHRQQEELIRRQEQLQRAHDHLAENSKSILVAQEAFESKQASMFTALDKLFTLHNAILHESRSIKAFFFYSFAIFIIYMLTSAKQTYNVRPRLYLGLCATFLIEFTIVRFVADDLDHQTWIASKVLLARSSFLLVVSIQILHAIFTYRDYEMLNHQMLLTLIEKVNVMEKSKLLSLDMESDDDLSSWIDTELPEHVDNFEDPDYTLPEDIGENSITTTTMTRKYDLRPRHHRGRNFS